MKFRGLPPLHALQTFEKAARELSFQKAAAQLHLTPSAVSHQIKALEAALGVRLFRRLNRALQLTEGGQAYLEVVEQALAQLRAGSRRVAERYGQRRSLRISTGPFIANEIIVPALAEFQDRHPGIDLRIDTDVRNVDLRTDEVDIALRFGAGQWPGTDAERLLTVWAVPVCAPALARQLRKREPAALDDVALIHSLPLPEGWELWSRQLGLRLAPARKDLWFDSYLAILRAAEQGAGLALGMVPIVSPWLRERRLAIPWPQLKIQIPQGYYLLHRADDAREEVRSFKLWLRGLLDREFGGTGAAA